MEALLKMGAPIAALFTHRDDAHEEIWWRSCAELAARHGVPVHFDESIDALGAKISAFKPALIYSFSYRHLIPASVLELAPLGAFNLHPSLLPAYRGRAPVNWVLVNGERETGVSLHYMVARADAGDIVGQRAVAIDDTDNALTLYRKLVPLRRRSDRRAASEDRCRHCAAAKIGYREGQLFRAAQAGRRKNRLALARAPDLQSRARRDASVSRRVLFRRRAKAAAMGSENRRGKWSLRRPGRIVRESADGALEIAAGEGSVIVKVAQFEGGVEGIAREALSQSGRVADIIQFD